MTDNGSPNLYDERSVTLTVGKRPTTIVYTGDSAEQYYDKQALTATLTDAGGGALNVSASAGKTSVLQSARATKRKTETFRSFFLF